MQSSKLFGARRTPHHNSKPAATSRFRTLKRKHDWQDRVLDEKTKRKQAMFASKAEPAGHRHRWETFTFDRVLYRDRYMHVTPSMLVIGGRFRFSRPVEIPVEDINRVRIDLVSRDGRGSSLGSGRGRKERIHQSQKIILHVCGNYNRQFKVKTESSSEAYRAIRLSMQTDYFAPRKNAAHDKLVHARSFPTLAMTQGY